MAANVVLTAILRASVGSFVNGLRNAQGQLNNFQNALKGLKALMDILFFKEVLGLLGEFLNPLRSMLGVLINSNAEWERMRIGLATIVSNSTNITDELGNSVSGQEKFNRALALSNDLMKQMRFLAAQNIGTTEDLLSVYTGIANVVSGTLKKGEEATSKTLKLANDITTTAKVLGPSVIRGGIEQATRESNLILSGLIRADNTFARAIGLTRSEFDKLKKQGLSTYEILSKKLSEFAAAQGVLAKSFVGVTDTIKDLSQFALTEIGKFGFDRLTQALNEFVGHLIITLPNGLKGFHQDILDIVNQLAPIFDELMIPLIDFTKELIKLIIDNKTTIIDLLRLSVQLLGLLLDTLRMLISVWNNLFQAFKPGIEFIINGLNLIISTTRSILDQTVNLFNEFTRSVQESLKPINDGIEKYIRKPLQELLSQMGLSTDLAKEDAKNSKQAALASTTRAEALGHLNN